MTQGCDTPSQQGHDMQHLEKGDRKGRPLELDMVNLLLYGLAGLLYRATERRALMLNSTRIVQRTEGRWPRICNER